MAVSIQELIDKQDEIKAGKNKTFDIETSVGVFRVKKLTASKLLEAGDMENGEGDRYIIVESVVEPNLKDKKLMDTFGCLEPTDVPDKLLDPGEVTSVARKIMNLSGYGKDIKVKVHDEIKN